MKQKQLEKLDQMIGQTYMYNGRNLTVNSYAVADGTVRIINTGHTISFPVDDLDEKIKEFLPTEQPVKNGLNGHTDKLINAQDNRISEIEQILADSIRKLQGKDGEKFLAQAREITNATNSIVKLNRLKLDTIKEARKMKEV